MAGLCVDVVAPEFLVVFRLLHLHHLVHADVTLGEVLVQRKPVVVEAAELKDVVVPLQQTQILVL